MSPVPNLHVLYCIYAHSADSEYVYEEMEGEMKSKLMALAENACTYLHRERYSRVHKSVDVALLS